jgi:AcrR family transcriptional regulator
MNDKLDLKTQRVRSFFLDAAKQIITAEGVEGVSARKVANIAGYSYATIYNYFKDLDELLSETKALMVSDIMRHLRDVMDFTPASVEDVKKLLIAYVQYYLEHPQIFRFFYFYRRDGNISRLELYDFEIPWAETFHFLVNDGSLKEDQIEGCAKSVIYAVHGLLVLFLSDNGLTRETLFTDLDTITDHILRK